MFDLGEYAAAAILDSVGSAAVENMADYIDKVICQQAFAEGLGLTPRISPGFGGCPLEEQRLVFALLPSDRMGVTLTPAYMMQPRKSISFAIGIGEGFTFDRGISRCRHCDMANCPYRAE